MSIDPPIAELRHFQNLTLKIKGQGHGWGHSSKSQCGSNILSTHIRFVPCQSGIPFLSYDFFKIWPLNPRSRSWERSKFKVTTWVQHLINSHPLMSIHPLIQDYDRAFLKFAKVKVIAEGHTLGITSYRLISLSFRVDRPSHSWDVATCI